MKLWKSRVYKALEGYVLTWRNLCPLQQRAIRARDVDTSSIFL